MCNLPLELLDLYLVTAHLGDDSLESPAKVIKFDDDAGEAVCITVTVLFDDRSQLCLSLKGRLRELDSPGDRRDGHHHLLSRAHRKRLRPSRPGRSRALSLMAATSLFSGSMSRPCGRPHG
jgi:hypothetical protein